MTVVIIEYLDREERTRTKRVEIPTIWKKWKPERQAAFFKLELGKYKKILTVKEIL